MAILLLASGLATAAVRPPLADPTPTVGLFLPYIARGPEPAPTPGPPTSDLRIQDIAYEGSLEIVEVVNVGSAPQDMTGWRLESALESQVFDFPSGLVLYPGSRAYLYSGPDAGNWPSVARQQGTLWVTSRHLFWTTDYVWDDYGGKGVLYDPAGRTVDKYCYGLPAGSCL
jgi:hypothetical protein